MRVARSSKATTFQRYGIVMLGLLAAGWALGLSKMNVQAYLGGSYSAVAVAAAVPSGGAQPYAGEKSGLFFPASSATFETRNAPYAPPLCRRPRGLRGAQDRQRGGVEVRHLLRDSVHLH